MNIKVNNCKNDNTIFNNKNWVEYTDEVKKALEKQIPEKWERMINPYGELEGFFCTCGCQSNTASNYCPNCGQKLD